MFIRCYSKCSFPKCKNRIKWKTFLSISVFLPQIATRFGFPSRYQTKSGYSVKTTWCESSDYSRFVDNFPELSILFFPILYRFDNLTLWNHNFHMVCIRLHLEKIVWVVFFFSKLFYETSKKPLLRLISFKFLTVLVCCFRNSWRFHLMVFGYHNPSSFFSFGT